jgi:activator of HSP90 ATPase
MKTGKIKQTIRLNATCNEVYDILMNTEKHQNLTRSKAKISTKEGGSFSTFDGYCTGKNIELIPGKKIVQEWHFKENEWPEDHFSVCTFQFTSIETGTQLVFEQTGIPSMHVDSLKKGWKEYYWEPMKQFLKH